MRFLLTYFWIGLISIQIGYAKQINLQLQLIDSATKASISDANIFLNNSSIGAVSNSNGYFELQISSQESQIVVITHILYETLFIVPEHYHNYEHGETIEMQSKNIDLNEIVVTAKKGKKWKKNFRKFKRTLLGEGIAASKCKILNPDVLSFEEKNGGLSVKAIDLLNIENDYLGYTIQFWLEELLIENNGSTSYHGYAHFIDKSNTNDTQFNARRETIYTQSLPHFLQSLRDSYNISALKKFGYELTFDRYEKETFKTIITPSNPNVTVQPDSLPNRYRLYFSEFLTVKHIGLKTTSSNEIQVSVSSKEQQKYGTSGTQTLGENEQHEVSRLYKIEPFLIFDRRGNIINKSAVREYGYWAKQRLALTLPIDYKKALYLDKKQLTTKPIDTLVVFQKLIGSDKKRKIEAISFLQQNWSKSYVAPLLDILKLSQDHWQKREIQKLLNEHVPVIKADFFNGIQWLWKEGPSYGTYYANLKAILYSDFDISFYKYFNNRENQTKIRLDEIIWGGVQQDGIPPLKSPTMIAAKQATYLSDTDIIFGVIINGEARAYPKRILAWHELFTDDIGEQSIAGVYCTLCGTVVVYNTIFNGVKHNLGTSGFLYRSNKLMYDQATQSLWSTLLGQPVVGPLVNQNIELAMLPVETTNWRAWRQRHPNTKVLSINTGHVRNYDEGEAYKTYFSDDNLMFPVIKNDKRLPNKARVFIPRPEKYDTDPLAISIEYLKRKRIHQDQIAGQSVIILTETNGSSRAYKINDQQFKSYKDGKLMDINNTSWTVKEDVLIGPKGNQLIRISAHEAFWFAWINIFPQTRIIYE